MENNSVRVGIIGVGNMGFAHATHIFDHEIDGMTLTALCDTDESRRDMLSERFTGIPVFATSGELLNSGLTDAVIVATPHRFHASIAIDALNAGMHVLTEKPEDITVSMAQKLNKVAEESGKVFGIMFNQRTNPLFAKAREIVQGGLLGEPKRFVWIITNWYRTQAYYNSGSWRASWGGEGGGVLLNQAPHNLDIWQWIFGMPSSITAFCDEAKYHSIEVEDDATIVARYKNGAVATFITTTGEYPGTNRLEISGDRGKLVLENKTLKWWRLSQPEREYCFSAEKGATPIDFTFEEHKQTEPEEAHPGILKNFTSAILNGTPLLAPGYDGINELMISNAAYLSSWTGRQVTLPLDIDEFDRLLDERIASSAFNVGNGAVHEAPGGYKKRWQVNW